MLRGFQEEARRHDFAVETFGQVGSWPLLALTRETSGAQTVYLSAGVHGDEPAPVEALLALLRAGVFDERFSWRICPVLNPTGLSLGTRENGEGVDLNRDYLLQQSAEVRAHRVFLESSAVPLAMISLHEDWESSGFYYYEISLKNSNSCYDGVRRAAEKVMPMELEKMIDGHETEKPGWIYHVAKPDRAEEWPEAIFLAEQGCPRSFTLETPSALPLAERVRCHTSVVEHLLDHFAQSE